YPRRRGERGERRQREGGEQPVCRVPSGGARDDGEARAEHRCDRREPRPGAHQNPRVSASRRRRSRSGRADVTYGTLSKFHSGGGEVVYHSSVSATQGSFVARGPVRDVLTMFTRNTSMPSPITYEPIDEIML